MTNGTAVTRQDVAEALVLAGYDLEERDFAHSRVTLATTPYALVACIEAVDWDSLDELVSNAQADLTEVAEEAPSARSWDLYLVVLMRQAMASPEQRARMEALESDTHYARKFIYAGLEKTDLDQALRPLLPLRPAADLEISDPLRELRSELLAIGIEEAVVTQALDTFESEDEVRLP